jgi:SagB-type dehydrogenase family enzyme
MTWREYHDATKHSPESLRQSQHFLDWANLPHPFRHYEGVPIWDLPADPPASAVPALALLQGACGKTAVKDGPTFLSQLLFYSASISAWKRAPSGSRYALRVNPSSGNLHPTEFHFLTRGLREWPDGLYHYLPSSHMAEQRASGDFLSKLPGHGGPLVFLLTSLAWREAWKYQERAYRYCLHDVGHAWQALALSAQAIGCSSFAVGRFLDDELTEFCGLPQDEWPMLILTVHGESIPRRDPNAGDPVWWGGHANALSPATMTYPLIESIHTLTKRVVAEPADITEPERLLTRADGIGLPAPASSALTFGEVCRARRSALNFVGNTSMSLSQLSAVLRTVAPAFAADFAPTRFVALYLYVHQVEGLSAGVYRYWPETAQLERIKSGDQRVVAAGLSLGQELAGNSCVTFSLIADLDRAVRSYGERGYRYVHFEAGAIGQRFYLAAEALHLRATGIGAFFDEEVHRYLELDPSRGQVVYHFAIGHPVPDSRVES